MHSIYILTIEKRRYALYIYIDLAQSINRISIEFHGSFYSIRAINSNYSYKKLPKKWLKKNKKAVLIRNEFVKLI